MVGVGVFVAVLTEAGKRDVGHKGDDSKKGVGLFEYLFFLR
jgi:hypothetical protein